MRALRARKICECAETEGLCIRFLNLQESVLLFAVHKNIKFCEKKDVKSE